MRTSSSPSASRSRTCESLGRLNYDVPSGRERHVVAFRVIVSRMFVNPRRSSSIEGSLALDVHSIGVRRTGGHADPAGHAGADGRNGDGGR